LSLVGSALAFVVSAWALRDAHHVGLSVKGAQPYDGARFFSRSTVLKVTIINPSVRTANLVHADVRFGGEVLADVEYAVPDINALSASARRELVGASLRLPVSIAPGKAVIAGLVSSNTHASVARALAKASNPGFEVVGAQPVAAMSWCHTVTYRNGKRVGPGPPPPQRVKSPGLLTVVMDFEPGGRKSATIPITPSFAGRTYFTDESQRFATGWHVELDVEDEHVRGLVLFKPIDQPPDLVRVELRRDARRGAQITQRQPLNDDVACIGFQRRLPPGRYNWSAAVSSDRVAEGTFRTPCVPHSDQPRARQSVDIEDCT
jgi:hypothetical protein